MEDTEEPVPPMTEEEHTACDHGKRFDSIQEEIAYLERYIYQDSVVDITSDQDLYIYISHTRTKTLTLVVKFLPDYPRGGLHIEVSSDTLPDKMMTNLWAKAEKIISEQSEAGNYHVRAVYDYFNELMKNNQLIPALGEVKWSWKLLKPGDTMRVIDDKGVVKFGMKNADQFINFSVWVPQEYPHDMLKVKLLESNIDVQVLVILKN